MAEKTLYDILEVSPSASGEAIRAAYERLSVKLDPDSDQHRTNPDAKAHYTAMKEAFLTLGNPSKRSAYDARRQTQARPAGPYVEEASAFWTMPKSLGVVVIALAIGGYFFQQHQKEQAQIAAAVAKAKAAEERAAAASAAAEEARLARAQLQVERQQSYAEQQAQRQRELDVRRFDAERRSAQRVTESAAERERRQMEYAAQREKSQQQMEERRAIIAAQQQAARDRAELCRLERERYGKAISC